MTTNWGHCGILDAQALARDIATNSYFFPSEGYCYSGPLKGTLLNPLTRLQATWKEWRLLHPETLVLLPPDDPLHRDPRSGHGGEEHWERPGMDQIFYNSLATALDRRVAENETVIGLNLPEGLICYPLQDIKLEGGVVHDRIGDTELVILSGPAADSFMVGVYEPRCGSLSLGFVPSPAGFIDRETKSVWNIEGLAVKGRLKGQQLKPIHFVSARYHTWVYPHSRTKVWRSKRSTAPTFDVGVFKDVLNGLREAGYELQIVMEYINLARPLECDRAVYLRINGDRFSLLHFENALAADDFAWVMSHSISAGLFVLRSDPDPDKQFSDIATNRVRMADQAIPWSTLVGDISFEETFRSAAHEKLEQPKGLGFKQLINSLREAGFDCHIGTPELYVDIPMHLPWLSYTALYPGCVNGIYVNLNSSETFIIYRCKNASAAKSFVGDVDQHALAAGEYVFRSFPASKFVLPRHLYVDKPDDRVEWSYLLADEHFIATLKEIVSEPAEQVGVP
jgi:hypothetical protein